MVLVLVLVLAPYGLAAIARTVRRARASRDGRLAHAATSCRAGDA
jgi:hypothetical protein